PAGNLAASLRIKDMEIEQLQMEQNEAAKNVAVLEPALRQARSEAEAVLAQAGAPAPSAGGQEGARELQENMAEFLNANRALFTRRAVLFEKQARATHTYLIKQLVDMSLGDPSASPAPAPAAAR